MASPQKENGYTAIANETMEALAKIRIPGVERQCLDFILRKTYGFNKKSDIIALAQFEKGTGLRKQHISRALRGLLSKKIIKITNIGNKTGKLIEFNKYYKTWEPLPKKITLPIKVKVVTNKGNRSLPLLGTTKVDSTKVDITKVNTTSEEKNHIPLRLSKKLFSLILQNDSKAKTPNFEKWSEDIEKLIRIDHRTPDEIYHVIQWTQQDDFWKSNILSASKLREQFPQLWLKANKQNKANGGNKNVPTSFAEKEYTGTPAEEIGWLNKN